MLQLNHSRAICRTFIILLSLFICSIRGLAANYTVPDLALAGMGGVAHSWEPGVHVIPGHEPAKATDGSLHTYWEVRTEDLPADVGVEWPHPQTVSSVIIRYFDGNMVPGPMIARTQQWARLQYWDNGGWKDIEFQMVGEETSSVWYTFSTVRTTRLRMLFTEPPDPETAHAPDQLGIYVCEFEAYSTPPFQLVKPPSRLVPIRRPTVAYNLEDQNDNPWALEGDLVIDPRETKIFTDELRPTLIVSESRWAKAPCAVEQSHNGMVELQNGFLRLGVSTNGELKETRITNLVTNESVATPSSTAFRIQTSQGVLTAANFKLVRVDTSGSNADESVLRVNLASSGIALSVTYELRRQDHLYHKWLNLTNQGTSDLQVLDLSVSSLGLPRLLDMAAGYELTYPIYRMKNGGLFECLETVYWDHAGDALTYYPDMTLEPGKSFESQKAVLGVYRNRGEELEHFDLGIRDWVIEYQAHVSPIRKEWPDIYIEGWSADFGIKQMVEDPKGAERFFATAHKMGVRYMDTNEGMNLALLMPPEVVQHWVDLANRYDIGTGFWIDFGSHENWGFMPLYYESSACKLSPRGQEYFEDVVNFVKRYRFRGFHWADFFTAWPCDDPPQGYLPGKYSIYAQGEQMIQFYRDLHTASPGLMLGADTQLGNPQYGRYADSRQHGGGVDAVAAVEPGIHLDRLYADMNRAAVWGAEHETYLHPWFRVLDCVNHFSRGEGDTHHQDTAGYRYALLSAIALAPQLTFNDAPDNISEKDIQFTQWWERWARDHADYLKEGEKLFDRTWQFSDAEETSRGRGGDQSLTGFAHIRQDRGYIFLINPDVVQQIAELTIALDAPPAERFVVQEVYPVRGMTLEGPRNGEYAEDDKLMVTVPPNQVRILNIVPASAAGQVTNFQPEDAGLAPWKRYVGSWTVVEHTATSATLRASFDFPAAEKSCLSLSIPESAWAREPWDYPKAYLVVLLKDEAEPLGDDWVSDSLQLKASVNGMEKTLIPFKTGRHQEKGKTRCYFMDLGAEGRSGEVNTLEITVPIQRGLVFSGAYLDLPDQVPLGIM